MTQNLEIWDTVYYKTFKTDNIVFKMFLNLKARDNELRSVFVYQSVFRLAYSQSKLNKHKVSQNKTIVYFPFTSSLSKFPGALLPHCYSSTPLFIMHGSEEEGLC